MTIEKRIAEKMGEEKKQKCVLVGIRINENEGLLLKWALMKIAEPGDRLVAVHVCRDSVKDSGSEEKASLDGYLEVYKGLCSVKQIDLTGRIARGRSVRKVVVREAKLCAAVTVVVGIRRHCALGGWVSMAKYCARRLPATTTILAIHNGKIVFQRCSINQTAGINGYQRPSINSTQPLGLKENQLHCGILEVPEIEKPGPRVIRNSEDGSREGGNGIKHDNCSLVHEYKEEEVSSSSNSVLMKELPDPTPGWPLLRVAVSATEETLKKEVSSSSISGGNDTKNDDINVVHEPREEVSSSPISVLMKELPDPMPGWPLLRRAVSATPETLREEVSSSSISGGDDTKSDNISVVHEHRKEVSSSSISVLLKELPDSMPGWPLLRIAVSVTPETLKESEGRNMSVIQWVMSLPNRTPPSTPKTRIHFGSDRREIPFKREMADCGNKSNRISLSAWGLLPKELELLFRTKSSGCRWFSHKELKNATSQFSSENLIGKGGCSSVYKGCLPDGKLVAVKILKLSKESWRDFILEVDIISSLKHKRIIPLIGVCLDGNDLSLVYDFLSKGSLQENLHGKKEKYVMSWEVRFNVAVGVAEAINYLYEECSRPVIHRDIKSSNILLSDEYEPQLSDFGLALWAPTSTSYETHNDVVGTFGYLAPEYFLYGRVSDKIDVYSFGVVLLELLTGRKPISTDTPKGQESLVMWAKPILESGDIMGILDPNLVGKFDEVQMRRMVLAITLCITRQAQMRPHMCQILKLLRGEKDVEERVNSHVNDQEDADGDEAYPESSVKTHLGLAMIDVDDDTSSFSSVEQNNRRTLKDYLKGRRSCSSSFG